MNNPTKLSKAIRFVSDAIKAVILSIVLLSIGAYTAHKHYTETVIPDIEKVWMVGIEDQRKVDLALYDKLSKEEKIAHNKEVEAAMVSLVQTINEQWKQRLLEAGAAYYDPYTGMLVVPRSIPKRPDPNAPVEKKGMKKRDLDFTGI